MDPCLKMSMPNIFSEPNKLPLAQLPPASELNFNCDQCVQCEQCGGRESGKSRFNKWSKDFKLCSICNKKRKLKQYCSICECFWPDEATEDPVKLSESLISCGACGMSVHYECDRIFEVGDTRNLFKRTDNYSFGEPL